ncbi:MAG: hypothetical protein CMJ49_07535 [Planctomycetaceae bacterium]|nr:hypothetical protein [Planctomycetaceae bacterium]
MERASDITSEAHARLYEVIQQHGDAISSAELRYCVPRLVNLLYDSHDHLVDDLTPSVRLLVAEHCDCDEGGDAPIHHADKLDVIVRHITRALEDLRSALHKRGQWSQVPVPPQLFG